MATRLRILADENIPGLNSALSASADIILMPGREIQRQHLDGIDALLVRSVTHVNAKLLTGSSVRFVGTATIGLDHIDLAYLIAEGIEFAYAPGSNAQSVVEYVLAAMAYWSKQQSKPWQELTVGIVGVGQIGGLLQAYLKQLGLRVLLCDPPRQANENNQHHNFLPLSAISDADVISFHVPLTTSGSWPTYQLIARDFLMGLNSNQLLVNTARGDILDNNMALDLYRNHSDLANLVLDVWQHEPAINVELLRHCFLATPHIAGYAVEAKWRATLMLCRALHNHFKVPIDLTVLDVKSRVKNPLCLNRGNESVSHLLNAYDIKQDDNSLTAVVAQLPEAFDLLRKNYPLRHEFLLPIT